MLCTSGSCRRPWPRPRSNARGSSVVRVRYAGGDARCRPRHGARASSATTIGRSSGWAKSVSLSPDRVGRRQAVHAPRVGGKVDDGAVRPALEQPSRALFDDLLASSHTGFERDGRARAGVQASRGLLAQSRRARRAFFEHPGRPRCLEIHRPSGADCLSAVSASVRRGTRSKTRSPGDNSRLECCNISSSNALKTPTIDSP